MTKRPLRPPPHLLLTDPAGIGPGTRIGGRWIVRDLLGRGGMAAVFEVQDGERDDAEPLACKVLDATHVLDALPRFERESALAARVAHPNVVRTVAFGTWTGRPYLVMERLVGSTLADRLRTARGPLGVREAIGVAGAVAEGLSALHDEGIAHRDLSASNVFLEALGGVKIMDFGSARPPDDAMGVRSSGLVLTAASSLPPERIAASTPGSFAGDVWALGVLLHRMLAGQEPFVGASPLAVMQRIVRSQPEPLSALRSDLPPGLSLLVLRALSKDPDDRPDLPALRAALTRA